MPAAEQLLTIQDFEHEEGTVRDPVIEKNVCNF